MYTSAMARFKSKAKSKAKVERGNHCFSALKSSHETYVTLRFTVAELRKLIIGYDVVCSGADNRQAADTPGENGMSPDGEDDLLQRL